MTTRLQRFVANVDVPDPATAADARAVLQHFVETRLPTIFEQHGRAEATRIDRLVVDIGPVASSELAQRAMEAIGEALERHRSASRANHGGDAGRANDRADHGQLVQALEQFVSSGRHAGPIHDIGFAALLETLDHTSPVEATSLIARMADRPGAVDRLQRQLTRDERERLSDSLNASIDAVLAAPPADPSVTNDGLPEPSLPERHLEEDAAQEKVPTVSQFASTADPEPTGGELAPASEVRPQFPSPAIPVLVGRDQNGRARASEPPTGVSHDDERSGPIERGKPRKEADDPIRSTSRMPGKTTGTTNRKGAQSEAARGSVSGSGESPADHQWINASGMAAKPPEFCSTDACESGDPEVANSRSTIGSAQVDRANGNAGNAPDKAGNDRDHGASLDGSDMEYWQAPDRVARQAAKRPAAHERTHAEGGNVDETSFVSSHYVGPNDRRKSGSAAQTASSGPRSAARGRPERHATRADNEEMGSGKASGKVDRETFLKARKPRLVASRVPVSRKAESNCDVPDHKPVRPGSPKPSVTGETGPVAKSASGEPPEKQMPDAKPTVEDSRSSAVSRSGEIGKQSKIADYRTKANRSSAAPSRREGRANLPDTGPEFGPEYGPATGDAGVPQSPEGGSPQAAGTALGGSAAHGGADRTETTGMHSVGGSSSSAGLPDDIKAALEPADRQQWSSEEKLAWSAEQIDRDIPSALARIRELLGEMPADLMAARLVPILSVNALNTLLVSLAPAYGGLLAYMLGVWSDGHDDSAVLRTSALAVSLSAPELAPQQAFERVLAGGAGQSGASDKRIARTLQSLHKKTADHPARAALLDMLALVSDAESRNDLQSAGRRRANPARERQDQAIEVHEVAAERGGKQTLTGARGTTVDAGRVLSDANRMQPGVETFSGPGTADEQAPQVNLPLLNIVHGTLSEGTWQQLAQQDMEVWCQEHIQRDPRITLDMLRRAARQLPARVIAARLAGVLPSGALRDLLAGLAPSYGGLIAYAQQLWGEVHSDQTLAVAALAVALERPDCAPQDALERMIVESAKALETASADLAGALQLLAAKGPDHPARTALDDMLGPLADSEAGRRLLAESRPNPDAAKFWSFLRTGVSHHADLIRREARASISGDRIEDLIAVLKQSPAARYRLATVLNASELALVRRRFPFSVAAHPAVQSGAGVQTFAGAQTGAISGPQTAATGWIRPLENTLTRTGGLILLWPFLERYYSELGLWTEDGFVDGEAHRRAVLLLHGLATGTYAAPEPALAIEKVLCGLDHSWSTNREHDPTEIELDLSEQLLTAVRLNTDTLKGSSNMTLRTTFLHRTGLLTRSREGGALTLTIENGPFDVLLDTLAWQISTIRLPWMLEVLHVKWR